jgi:hypothetical protein
MTTYIVAVHLLIESGEANPGAGVAAALDSILPDVGSAALVDWAVAGIDLADSMAAVSVPPNYRPGQTCFPSWPGRLSACPQPPRRPDALGHRV